LKEKMERTVEEVRNDVLDFFRVRYQISWLDRKVLFDVTEAVLTVSFDELPDVQAESTLYRRQGNGRILNRL